MNQLLLTSGNHAAGAFNEAPPEPRLPLFSPPRWTPKAGERPPSAEAILSEYHEGEVVLPRHITLVERAMAQEIEYLRETLAEWVADSQHDVAIISKLDRMARRSRCGLFDNEVRIIARSEHVEVHYGYWFNDHTASHRVIGHTVHDALSQITLPPERCAVGEWEPEF